MEVAASVVGFVGLSMQLLDSYIRLRSFFNAVSGAPNLVSELLEDLLTINEMLEPLRVEDHLHIEVADHLTERILRRICEKTTQLADIVAKLDGGGSKKRSTLSWQKIKTAIRETEITSLRRDLHELFERVALYRRYIE